jgi:DNA invertase Pin-like site-specific DNA recombinase
MSHNNGDKTYCLCGHELSGENVYVNHRGERQCRACCRLRARSARWRSHGVTSSGPAKLTADKVREMHSRHLSGERYRSLAKAFGVTYSAVEKIIRGARWPNIHKEFHPVLTSAGF